LYSYVGRDEEDVNVLHTLPSVTQRSSCVSPFDLVSLNSGWSSG